jgi:sugar O-acyltransferase (sialic acid O-acetyltransferase NeuD family)
MAKVIIYGIEQISEIAYYYLLHESNHQVVAFCVNEPDLPIEKEFKNLPLISFESIGSIYSNNEYEFFAPMSSEKMNTEREKVYNSIKEKGYKMISFISNKSVVYTKNIGDNCFIQAGNVIQPFTKIGNNVMLWSGNLVAHHSEVKDHVTFASHVAVAANCYIGENSYLGTNSTIRDGIRVGKGTLVGLATAITKNTEEWSVYIGNPAKKIGNNISKSILKI